MPGYLPRRAESGLEPALAAVILALASGPHRPRRSCGTARVPRLTWCWAGAMRGMKWKKPGVGSVHSCYYPLAT